LSFLWASKSTFEKTLPDFAKGEVHHEYATMRQEHDTNVTVKTEPGQPQHASPYQPDSTSEVLRNHESLKLATQELFSTFSEFFADPNSTPLKEQLLKRLEVFNSTCDTLCVKLVRPFFARFLG
jgi:hypothetical protein